MHLSGSICHRKAAFLESYFDVLFAANRLLHPGEKRLIAFAVANCKVLPKDFEKDIAAALENRTAALPTLLSEMVEKLRACPLRDANVSTNCIRASSTASEA